ncbi:MAG TPA: cupredoxin family copper-binding protein [Candidatus Acidoferrales bacterium]|nr:cupredoxin family copper-binding protein [Candidatus Acidoferrales bacterium]
MKLISKSIVSFALLVASVAFAGGPVRAQSMAGKSVSGDATPKTASKSFNVEIKDFAFAPATITVPIGAKITWVNKDEEPHTVTSTDRVFISKALDTDDQFSVTLDKPGTYEYFCSVHPRMVAKIVVVAAKDKQLMKMDKMGKMN